MPLNTGAVIINRYRIAKLLGQGGFGAVYKAWDLNLNRPCALKENLDASPEAGRQFVREAQVLANLVHASLPRVIDYFSVPGQGQYLVMDLVDGEDLESMVTRQGVITTSQSLGWIAQIADALTYLHSQNPPVIHRDIKPANIRITPGGRAMLVDFGLVKVYDPHVQTTQGARAVTPGYSPPEQYGQGPTDARTDVYALAATLYTLLTGQQPQESVQRVGGDHVMAADSINRQVTATVGQTIQQAMALIPRQRYQTIADFKAALQLTPAASPIATPPVSAPPGPNRFRNLTVFGFSVSVLIIVGGMLVQALSSFLSAPVSISVSTPIPTIAAATPRASATHTPTTAAATKRATATAAPTATATATATPSPTVDVWATAQTRAAFVANVQSGLKRSVTTPDGSLRHNGSIPTDTLPEKIKDVVIEAKFYNPYAASAGAWDYGFMFRDEGGDNQFRLIVDSKSEWQLFNFTGDISATPVASGTIDHLDVNDNGSNVIKLIAQNGI